MSRNRFKENASTVVDFDDPSVLAVIPEEVKPTADKNVTPEKESDVAITEIFEKKAEGKNFTLYLDLEVVEKLDEISAQTGLKSRSKVANTLLRKVLFGK